MFEQPLAMVDMPRSIPGTVPPVGSFRGTPILTPSHSDGRLAHGGPDLSSSGGNTASPHISGMSHSSIGGFRDQQGGDFNMDALLCEPTVPRLANFEEVSWNVDWLRFNNNAYGLSQSESSQSQQPPQQQDMDVEDDGTTPGNATTSHKPTALEAPTTTPSTIKSNMPSHDERSPLQLPRPTSRPKTAKGSVGSPSEDTDITAESVENWPFSYRSDAKNTVVMLPPLSHVIGRQLGEDAGLRSELSMLLSRPFNERPYTDSDVTNIEQALPSSTVLEEFLDLFFNDWYHVVPTIHRATWDHKSATPILKSAMVSIGAGFSDRPDAHNFGDNLSELTKRAINWMIDNDGNSLRNEDFISAMLYQAIYSLGSGNKRLYETADSSRTVMVTSARAMGLFDVKAEDFEDWVDYERRKRIAWLLFEFDCTICTLTSSRPCISIHDLKLNLPCDADVWECRRPWQDGPSFTQAFTNVLQGNLDPNLSWYSKRLISQTLGRGIWDYAELESSLVFKPLRLSEEPKLRLLQALNSIRGGVAKDLEAGHVTMIGMINAYSHMFNSHIMDHITAATKMPTPSNVSRLRNELDRDPRQSRYLAWQASIIIAVVTNKPIYTPCESMRIFMAGLYLYWFSLSKASHPGTASLAGMNQVVRLDVVPWTTDKSKQIEWVNNGHLMACIGTGNDSVTIGGVEGAISVLRAVVTVLKRLRPWGIAVNFSNVLTNLETSTGRLNSMLAATVESSSAASVAPRIATPYSMAEPPYATMPMPPGLTYGAFPPLPMSHPSAHNGQPAYAHMDQPRIDGTGNSTPTGFQTPVSGVGATGFRPESGQGFRQMNPPFVPAVLQPFR
jgi:hypothetical protein